MDPTASVHKILINSRKKCDGGHYNKYVSSEVYAAVNMKHAAFWKLRHVAFVTTNDSEKYIAPSQLASVASYG
jgi:hypothetical protein